MHPAPGLSKGLANLRKTAKRWLKALRAGDHEARERLRRAYPHAPAEPGLRDVQHALARERGHESWTAAQQALASTPGRIELPPTGGRTHAERVATFLEFACWDHHTHGKGDHRMYDRAAQRLLAQHPEIARDSLYAAIVCGDLQEVGRILAERPEAAREPGGSRGWTPLLYLCYTRFTHQPTIDNALEIARALLDQGANPNDFYMAGHSEYSALVGAAGEGEQDSPRQPYAEALYRRLLERGAGPYDIQVLYNTHFSGDMIWWLDATYQHALKTGRKADWDDPDWSMLDMGGYGSGAHFVLGTAVRRNSMALAEWALAHGASPNSDTSANPKFKLTHTLYETAVLSGHHSMAALLLGHGARAVTPLVGPDETFIDACMRLDGAAVRALLEAHPEYLRSHAAMFEAARRDRPDVIAFLLDLGVPPEIADAHNTRALHHAAASNALRAAKFLVDRGAEIDPRETQWDATPIGWAAHGDKLEMVEFLSHYTRTVWTLAFRGYVERLREVLRAEPDLAKQVTSEGITPLWWLPDDEEKAMEIVELFLAAGADPAIRSREGGTAADWALKRGMADVARRLGVHGEMTPPAEVPTSSPPPAESADLATYEGLAQDLVSAYDTGNVESMRRLMDHFGVDVTWDRVRAIVPQRLERIGHQKPGGSLALSQARLLIAHDTGFDSWSELERTMSASLMSPATRPIAVPPPDASGAPVEMRAGFRMRLHDNTTAATSDVWSMLTAATDGDLARVRELTAAYPSLVRCEYNYMPPLHLAVREGRVDIVRFLAARGAVNPKYVTYPYKEPLLTVATDREYAEIAQVLLSHSSEVDPDRPGDESGHIEYEVDFERRRFQRLVGANARGAAEELLRKRPELATDPFAFWSEGTLMMPANRRDRQMLELLMHYGARVPDTSKWGKEYYFKHYDIAVFLMDSGMNPNHMNCHRTTLLHGMAFTGDLQKAALLLDRGADIDAVDEEFRSTPLGFAARWGNREMVALLLDRGADPNLSGAPWATPLEWARKKGHAEIEADLRRAGVSR
jgi:ankyrin repeat protein